MVPSGAENAAILPASPALRFARDCTESSGERKKPDALTQQRDRTIRTDPRESASGCTKESERGIEAVIIGFKPGSNGHAGLVGAVEFGIPGPDGSLAPIAWVSSLSDLERLALIEPGPTGDISFAHHHLGRRAVLAGQDLSPKAGRIRHARLVRWIDPLDVKAS